MIYDVKIVEKNGKENITTDLNGASMIAGVIVRSEDNKKFLFCNSFTFNMEDELPLEAEEMLRKAGFERKNTLVKKENASDNSRIGSTTRSPFRKTVDGMLSDDYKERFKAEYKQTKIRYERLHTFNTKILASKINVESEEPKHDCPESVLLDQEKTMRKYLEILELRAAIEKIDLT